jgi:hypothetical protein
LFTGSEPQSVNSAICSSVAGIDDRNHLTGAGPVPKLVEQRQWTLSFQSTE